MSKVSEFQSAAQIEHTKNLDDYIATARKSHNVWKDLAGFNWDSQVWPTLREKISFHKVVVLPGGNGGYSATTAPLDSDFIDFAKAYILTSRGGNAAKTHNRDIAALRVLEAAMLEIDGSAKLSNLKQSHLDRACAMLENTIQNILGMGGSLQALVRHIASNNLCAGLSTWTHPFKKTRGVGECYKRSTQLPDDNALLALADVFSEGYRGKLSCEATYITGICTIYLSAPMRIGESSWLTPNSLRTGEDALGNSQLYIEHYSPKVKNFFNKEIPAIMGGHCKEAFTRMEEAFAPGRALAKHLESGSMKFYRHENCPEVDDDQILTSDELMAALGRHDMSSVRHFLRSMTGTGSAVGWTLNALWPLIIKVNMDENPYFPYQLDTRLYKELPPKMSESLVCLLSGQLAGRETNPVVLASHKASLFHNRTKPSHTSSANVRNSNFFEKHGFGNLHLSSHQLRHFLNTAADEAGTDIEFITQWSGRASFQQTRDYIHRDQDRVAKELGKRLIPLKEVDPQPITKEEYDLREKGPIITTRYGICMHPWTVSPCEKSGDCLNCSELLHCKGHKASLGAVIEERDHVKENLEVALAEIEAGRKVVTRWVEQFQKYLERLNAIVAMHTDPSIEDGSPVQMPGKDFSQAKRILAKNGPEPLILSQEYSSDLLDFMKNLVST